MNTKTIVIGGLVVLALLFGAFLFLRPAAPTPGAVNPTGPQHFQMEAFIQGVAAGTRNQFSISNLGNITDTVATAVHTLLGTLVVNELIQSGAGFSSTYSTANGTTLALTTASFCGVATVLIPITSTTTLTVTLPSATSTQVGCGAPLGSFSTQLIDNESSSAVTFATTTGEVPGQGVRFWIASSTPGTNATPAVFASASGIVVPASTTVQMMGQYTGTSTTNAILNVFVTFFKKL